MLRAALGLLVLGVVVTIGFMLHAGEPAKPTWWLFLLPFAAWALAPYLLVAVLAFRLHAQGGAAAVLALAALLLAGSSALLLWLAFVAEPDPQSGLVFVVLPFWQLAAAVPLGLLARWLARRHTPL